MSEDTHCGPAGEGTVAADDSHGGDCWGLMAGSGGCQEKCPQQDRMQHERATEVGTPPPAAAAAAAVAAVAGVVVAVGTVWSPLW